MRCFFLLALFMPFLSLLHGCEDGGSHGSGGGNGSGPAPPNPVIDLSVSITFPLPSSSLRGVAEILVKGMVTDVADGSLDEGDIAEFAVNGITTDVDVETGQWQQTVPVSIGPHQVELAASIADGNGQQTTELVRVDNQSRHDDYHKLDLEPSGSLLVQGSGSLRRIDLGTLSETLVQDETYHFNDVFGGRRNLLVDASGERVHMLADGAVRLELESGEVTQLRLSTFRTDTATSYFYFDVYEDQFVYTGLGYHYPDEDGYEVWCGLSVLDMETGESRPVIFHQRTGMSSPDEGEAYCPGTLLVDHRENRAIVADETLYGDEFPGLYAVDLLTGDRSPVSGAGVGLGPVLDPPEYMFWRNHGESVLAVSEMGVSEVELASGDRTQLLVEPDLPADRTDMAFDEAQNRLLIASGRQIISSLDLASGEREELVSFSNGVGVGPDMSGSTPMVFDGVENRLLVLDSSDHENDQLVEINLKNLQRRTLARPSNFSVSSVVRTSLDEQSSILYLAAFSFGDGLITLQLTTGEERVLVDRFDDLEPRVNRVHGMCLDDQRDLLYLATEYELGSRPHGPITRFNGVLSVDIVSGERLIVSSDIAGDAILCDPINDRLLVVTEREGIYEVSPETGEYELLVPITTKTPCCVWPRSFAWDSVDGRVLLGVDRSYSRDHPEGVLSIDLATGEYEFVLAGVKAWAYDPQAELFFTSDHIYGATRGGAGEFYAIDRHTGTRVVIASPE